MDKRRLLMAEYNKQRYYWIKLTDHFLTSDTVDFLLSQKNGANYVVLYQMLCLKSVNSNGLLARQIGEIIVPYDVEKIQRDCKHFDIDTVRVALELYKKLGLVYEQQDGILQITNFDRLIGSQTISAEKKQIQIANRQSGKQGGTKVENFPPDIKILRDKEIDNKEIDIKDIEEKDINVEKESPTDKPSSPAPKHKYGQYKNVLLTEKEYNTLIGMTDGKEAIDFYSEYRAYKGYTAKSDYLAIRKWAFNGLKEQRAKNGKQTETVPKEELIKGKYTRAQVEDFARQLNISYEKALECC
jgi:predicted phage replisome organizer